jgi:hypothetical protein
VNQNDEHLLTVLRYLEAIRRASATGLPYGDAAWVKRLELDLIIRPRGRPRKYVVNPQK